MKRYLHLILFCLGITISSYSQPSITSFSPTYGATGSLITITGTNLSSPTAFTIDGVAALVISNNGTTLVGYVMPGTTTGIISVTTASGTGSSTTTFTVTPTRYPSVQQGSKLVASGGVGNQEQGFSVAISTDGNTAIVGGDVDNSGIGAAWIYTRSGGSWSQQGSKLVGSNSIGAANQGWFVNISADGNTAIVGGFNDNSQVGAAWIYSRNGGIWTQQGPKLVGTGAVSNSAQGFSVALSADGNTALVGGIGDAATGASWVYTRSSGVWSQQGSKLVGGGEIGSSMQGYYVSLSADGNTAIIGGPNDNSGIGAVWIFTRTAGVWTQQGNKLVGTGAVGSANQGTSVALNADGNTAITGGYLDSTEGAVWVFTRNGVIWSQQGPKLVGSGAIGNASQGYSVSLSADGSVALVGGYFDNSNTGASWVFTRNRGVWSQQGNKLVGTGGYGGQGCSVSLSGDGNTAIMGAYGDNSQIGAAWVFISPSLGFVWTGVTSTSWFIGSNWSGGVVPGVNDDVTIPSGTPFSLIVPSGIPAKCRSIYVLPNATLTVSSNSTLNVTH